MVTPVGHISGSLMDGGFLGPPLLCSRSGATGAALIGRAILMLRWRDAGQVEETDRRAKR